MEPVKQIHTWVCLWTASLQIWFTFFISSVEDTVASFPWGHQLSCWDVHSMKESSFSSLGHSWGIWVVPKGKEPSMSFMVWT